jgi:hypothetical protein
MAEAFLDDFGAHAFRQELCCGGVPHVMGPDLRNPGFAGQARTGRPASSLATAHLCDW